MDGGHRPPRLFTARFANKTLVDHPAAKVRITLGHPRFRLNYELAGKIPDLAPTREMFNKTEVDFTALYTALLIERGGIEHLTQRFASVTAAAGTDDLVLLCFERLTPPTPGVFCHRRVFAEWWTAATKQPVLELPEV